MSVLLVVLSSPYSTQTPLPEVQGGEPSPSLTPDMSSMCNPRRDHNIYTSIYPSP